jgi:hypothetical protein
MTNIENTTGNSSISGAEHKHWLRELRIDRSLGLDRGVRNGSKKRRNNEATRPFHVLAADGSIDKRATRERRLFGPDATPVVGSGSDENIGADWDGRYVLKDDGSIDKQATRERRLFGEPEDLYGRNAADYFFGDEEGDADNSFHVIDEDGCIDKQATRERRLFGSSLWN